jgi:hypothetical protein
LKIKSTIKRSIFLLLILFIVSHSAFSVITATYTPASSLVFKLGNEISVPPNTPAGTFSSSKLVAYLGSIKITKSSGSDHYYRPLTVNYGTANEFTVSGRITQWGGGVHETGFYTYVKNSMIAQPYRIHLGDSQGALYDWQLRNEITANPFIVDIFLVSHFDSYYYIEDEIYTIVSGTLGSFNILVSTDSDFTKEGEIYISINGQEVPQGGEPPADPIPIPGGGHGAPIPEIPYGEEPLPLGYSLNIINKSPFLISGAYNGNVNVATAELALSNGEQGQQYEVQVKFTNPQNLPNFTLRPDGNINGYPIPYKMRFGNENIIGSSLMDWKNLNNGINQKDIFVYDVNPNDVSMAPAGPFKDTILVEIFSSN